MTWKICTYGNRTLDQCFSNCVAQHTDVPWKIYRCAASIFKVLYVDTSFLPKLRKCCHEVTTDLCRKSQVGLQVSLLEVMTFFLEIRAILGSIQRFPEIVAQRDDNLQKKRPALFSLSSAMPLRINWNRFQWLVCREICSTDFLCRQTKKFGKH